MEFPSFLISMLRSTQCSLTIYKQAVLIFRALAYNPEMRSINIVAKHEIRCEVPAPILPHRRMTKGATRSMRCQFLALPLTQMCALLVPVSCFLVYHLGISERIRVGVTDEVVPVGMEYLSKVRPM